MLHDPKDLAILLPHPFQGARLIQEIPTPLAVGRKQSGQGGVDQRPVDLLMASMYYSKAGLPVSLAIGQFEPLRQQSPDDTHLEKSITHFSCAATSPHSWRYIIGEQWPPLLHGMGSAKEIRSAYKGARIATSESSPGTYSSQLTLGRLRLVRRGNRGYQREERVGGQRQRSPMQDHPRYGAR